MWQSHLEIEHYCVASFDCITTSITPNNTAFVHHIIVYLCGALVNITEGTSSECTGQITLDPINECRRGTASPLAFPLRVRLICAVLMHEYLPH